MNGTDQDNTNQVEETPKTCLTDGSPVTEDHREIDPTTGMQKGYVVLTEEERKKGFVRPLRDTYQHVGKIAHYPLRDLTEEEKKDYAHLGYVKFEKYPEGGTLIGRYWTEQDLKGGCKEFTTMGKALAETYARDPKFYTGTFCATCKKHYPVGEFVWLDDGTVVGS